MSQNAHDPAYEGVEPVKIPKTTKFGGAPAAPRGKGKYGGGGGEAPTKSHMSGLFKRVAETPEEARAMQQDREADVEVEAQEPVEIEPAESAPAEAEAPEATAEPEPANEATRRVPLGELLAEREKRKQLQAKIEQLEGTFQRFVDRAGQPATPAPAAPEPPPFDSDPIANLAHRQSLAEQQVAAHNAALTQQQAMTQFQQALASNEMTFRAATPDYDAAINHLRQLRDAELATLGYNPAERQHILTQEIVGVSAAAMNRGQNPAELFYAVAKQRGWAAAPKPESRLATVAKGQQRASGPKGGVAPAAAVTLENLASMDDDEFDRNFDKLWRRT